MARLDGPSASGERDGLDGMVWVEDCGGWGVSVGVVGGRGGGRD